MKYGFCFLILFTVLMLTAIRGGIWYFVLVYLAISFAIVGIGYFGVGPRIFGKSAEGKRKWSATFFLLPYLLLTLVTWHLIRMLSRESPVNQLNPNFLLSRRLLASEMPLEVKSVVDLTCELSEPRDIGLTHNYLCYPILDASSLTPQELVTIAKEILNLPKSVLIHCAQGHRRTGLIAAAVLFVSGKARSSKDAISMVRAVRPGIELNSVRRKTLDSI